MQLVGLRARTRKSVIFEKKTSHSRHAARSFFFFSFSSEKNIPGITPSPLFSDPHLFLPERPLPHSPFFLRFELDEPSIGQQMVFERQPPPPKKKEKKKTGLGVRWRWMEGGREGGGYRKKNQSEIGRMRTFRGCGTVEPSGPESREKKWRQPECKLNPPHSCKYCLSH